MVTFYKLRPHTSVVQLRRNYASGSDLDFQYPRTKSWTPGTSERATRNYLIAISIENL